MCNPRLKQAAALTRRLLILSHEANRRFGKVDVCSLVPACTKNFASHRGPHSACYWPSFVNAVLIRAYTLQVW
jgi:hypothetical protein